MRYLIILLVVLSFTASFGSYELDSAQTVGADRFAVTAGGMFAIYTGFVPHLGVEYGLSENFSLSLRGNYSLCLSLKTNYAFENLPLSLGFSLGGELNSSASEQGSEAHYSFRNNWIFQAWFFYLGFTLNSDFSDSRDSIELSLSLGFDIEFNDSLSLLIALGSHTGMSSVPGHSHGGHLGVGMEIIF